MSDRLVWIDCEMTGLDLGSDLLVEVAALVTDSELNVLGEGVDVVIGATRSRCRGCRRRPGDARLVRLTDEVLASTVTLQEAEQRSWPYIKAVGAGAEEGARCAATRSHRPRLPHRDMTELDDWLHYRMVDVSSVKELARRWYPRSTSTPPRRAAAPRAGRHPGVGAGAEVYTVFAAVFVQQPGPIARRGRSHLGAAAAVDPDAASGCARTPRGRTRGAAARLYSGARRTRSRTARTARRARADTRRCVMCAGSTGVATSLQ
jgi:oligoribonuclease